MVTVPSLRAKLAWQIIGTWIMTPPVLLVPFASRLGDAYLYATAYYAVIFTVTAFLLIATEYPVWKYSGREIKAFLAYETLIGVALAAILFFFRTPILKSLSISPEIFYFTREYIEIGAFAIPFLALISAVGFYLLGIGKRKLYILLYISRMALTAADGYILLAMRYPLVWAVLVAESLSAALAVILLVKSRAKK
jgi:Na+-driven multidrug efflux pump